MWLPVAPVVCFVMHQFYFAWGVINGLFYLKVPFHCAYDESLGFILEGRIRLSEISACSRRRSQFCIGNYGPIDHTPAVKLSLNVLVTHSSTIQLFIPNRASFKSMSLAWNSCLNKGGLCFPVSYTLD